MKSPVLLISVSLLVNVGLLAAFMVKPDLVPIAVRGFFQSSAAQKADRAAALANDQRSAEAKAKRDASKESSARSRLWSTLDSGDLPTLVAHLRAAGFSAATIRAIISARLERNFASRRKELMGSRDSQPFWKSENIGFAANQKLMVAMNQMYHERTKQMRDLLGDDFFANGESDSTVWQRRQFGNLSRTKIDLVQGINDDYQEMMSQTRAAMQGIVLPEDREKMALLEREKHADLASVLSPVELEDYEMRTSQTTMRLRQTLTAMNATEDEFRAIFRVEQPFADKLNPSMGLGMPAPDAPEQRRTAQEQIAEQLKTVLGDQRYADYMRANNGEFQQLTRIAQNANVDNDAVIRAFNLRDSVSQESNRIFSDPSMTDDQKRNALQVLAQNTKTQIVSTLGQTAGDAYIQTASRWLSAVERGGAITFGANGTNINTRMLPRTRPATATSH